jgi:ABC-type lipoprotein export system ATPase subunit
MGVMTEPLVNATELYKSYRRGSESVHALEGVSLTLNAAEVAGLIGPSGSGKTTLLNVLSGWETAEGGQIKWADGRRFEAAELPWRLVSLIPQSLGLVEELSVRENVELPARIAGVLDREMSERVESLLERLGLDQLAHRPPEETSLGEQQRAAVARALVLRPALVLADEPTGHQDAEWATNVFWMLKDAAKEGSCCLVATHNKEVIQHAHRIVAMLDGRVEDYVEEEPAEALMDDSIWAPSRDERYYSPRT